MAKFKKCIRCKKEIISDKFCQDCKDDLLSFFEATRDWQMAYEMELQQQYLMSFQKDSDVNEKAY